MEQKKILFVLFLFFVQGSLSKVSIDFILLAYLHINQKKKKVMLNIVSALTAD